VSGLPLARLFGIEIRVSYAWAFLLAVVTFIGSQQASATSPGLGVPLHWVIGVLVALGFLATVVAHELAHALVGRRCGVPTTGITLGFIGGLAPLSIEASRPRDEMAIAVAGPLVSLGVALASLPAAMVVGATGGAVGGVAGGVLVVGGLNLLIAALSLLPAMPLDGGRAVRAIAWAGSGSRDRAGAITARVGRMLGWTTVGVGVALALADMITGGLMVLCLGWLLTTGAKTLDKRVRLEHLLSGATVADATRSDMPRIDPGLSVDTFAARYEGDDGYTCLPVVEGDTPLGVIGARRLHRLGRRRFSATRAADVMASPPTARFLEPGEDLWPAVEMMDRQGLDGLAVVVDGRLEGMVTRESIGNLILRRTGGVDAAGLPGAPG
jgi:Zn-dependent protease/predicted transcriptional regulator